MTLVLSNLNAEGILPITCERTVRRTSIITRRTEYDIDVQRNDLLISKYYFPLMFGQIEWFYSLLKSS